MRTFRAGAEPFVLSISLYLDLQELWIGCYWERDDNGTLSLHFCALPMLVLRVRYNRRGLPEDAS